MTDMIELARRAVACKHWRWMRGMGVLSKDGKNGTFIWAAPSDAGFPDQAFIAFNGVGPTMRCVELDSLTLDLTDPATLGCLLQLVRDAYPERAVWSSISLNSDGRHDHFIASGKEFPKDERWYMFTVSSFQPTEAEALVQALENAP